VRPDENVTARAVASVVADSGCTSPAGASPVRVGREAPGSRPQVDGREAAAQAGRRKPLRREQEHGPQHEVKPATSTDKQWESRAAHVTAKATSAASVQTGEVGLPGVRGAARVQGDVRNRRGPSAPPSSRQGGPYKPKAKSGTAQRESEGAVVPMMVAQQNAAGGKGLCFGRVRGEGKREGMAGKTGPNDPGEQLLGEEARRPQGELPVEAKRTRLVRNRATEAARRDARVAVRVHARVGVVHASLGRPSASRVREIRMHGLKGGPAPSPMRNIR